MERIEYDPEIDPSIREEREAAEREQELTARIRIEIERYVEENDLVPREQSGQKEIKTDEGGEAAPVQADKPGKKTVRAAHTTVQSVFSGSILTSEWMRRMWPYLLGIAALLVLYIAHTFHLQKLHMEQQNLERQVRELSIESVGRTAERVRQTRRSEIVKRLEKNNIPLKELPYPVKTIKKK